MLDFKPITLRDREMMQPFFDEWQFEGSELTFSNLFLWQPSHDIQYCIFNDVLYIKLSECGTVCFMPPIPARMEDDYHCALETAALYCEQNKIALRVRCANTKLKERMEFCCKARLEFESDIDNYDYVYLTQDLIELPGKKYHAKRNHIRKFLSEYDAEYKSYSEEYLEDCWELYKRWSEGKDMHPGEPHAVRMALENYRVLGLKGGMLLIGGRVEAFSMGEQITRDMAVIHIEKAAIPGAFSYINQQFALHEWSGLKYLNREEDMGIEGMRKAKMSYHPAYQIEKFSVAIKDRLCQED